jgi:hypothetical protein
MGLVPGTSFYLVATKFTKQKGFGNFDIAGYWSRKYAGKQEDEGWYLLTNVGSLKQSIDTFKCRSGIEAMFKDCKTGGDNLERSHANNQGLSSLILLIALAYSCAIIQGQKIQKMGVQKYVGRVTECGRKLRRHSSFWIGLLASILGRAKRRELAWNFVKILLRLLMRIRRNKLPFFQRGLRAMSFILSMF